MQHKELLLVRLEAIGISLRDSGQALALLALGSVGIETERLDNYSDLDFFAIVQPGCKMRYIDNLDWLINIKPFGYCFRNTADGYKLLFEDGVFCEFAVFEPHELEHIPFTPGRVIWQEPHFDSHVCMPRINQGPEPSDDIQWLIGEALTNIYVGMCRYNRGEKLSAMRFIQQYSIDRILDLASHSELEKNVLKDPFVVDRRFEQRCPVLASKLPSMMQGYSHSPQSAMAQVAFLDEKFGINDAIKKQIERLCSQCY